LDFTQTPELQDHAPISEHVPAAGTSSAVAAATCDMVDCSAAASGSESEGPFAEADAALKITANNTATGMNRIIGVLQGRSLRRIVNHTTR
jgi:hypothetical protein